MLTAIFLLIIGFAVLTKSADWLIDGASSIAKKFKIPDLVIGLTILAFGTSAPELTVNIVASIQGNAGITIGNVLGSNITNILVGLGIVGILTNVKVGQSTVWKEIPLYILATALIGIFGNDIFMDQASSNIISRTESFAFIGFFLVFIYYTINIVKNHVSEELAEEQKTYSTLLSALMIIGGLTGLALGGKMVVDNAVEIARLLNISESLIGLTIIALGTSLPEIMTSIIAATKKKMDLAVGNIIGSNLFNIFLVLGVSGLINPIPFAPSNNIDVTVALAAGILLFAFLFIGPKYQIKRWSGLSLVIFYVVYIGYLVYQG